MIGRANHVWCADITHIPVRRGFLHPVAIMDWASRHVLAWRLSNTLDAGFCTDALDEALTRHGAPEIFNTDQAASSPASPSPGACGRLTLAVVTHPYNPSNPQLKHYRQVGRTLRKRSYRCLPLCLGCCADQPDSPVT